jgi:hypothetical protein
MLPEKASWCVNNFWDFLTQLTLWSIYLTDQLALSPSINRVPKSVTCVPASRDAPRNETNY